MSIEVDGVFRAPVIIDGHELFYVRGSTALPGTKYAVIVGSRIIASAKANDSDTVEISFNSIELGQEILAHGELITVVTNADAELEQLDIPVLTKLQGNAYTTRGTSIPRIKSDLHKHIVAVFNENKVQIMTPSYVADTPEPKIAENVGRWLVARIDHHSC